MRESDDGKVGAFCVVVILGLRQGGGGDGEGGGRQRNLEILVWEGGSASRGEMVVVVRCWT